MKAAVIVVAVVAALTISAAQPEAQGSISKWGNRVTASR